MSASLSTDARPRAFVIVSRMRSGSTLLVRHLRQVRAAACFGEILRADFPEMEGWSRINRRLDLPASARSLHARSATRFWDLVLERLTPRKRFVGAKILTHQRRDEDIWERIAEADHRVIHLRRDSTFESWVSLRLAMATGEWKLVPGQRSDDDHPRVDFDADAYRRYRDTLAADVAAVRARYAALPSYVELEYAELTDLGAMERLIERLFGERLRLEARLVRQRPLPKLAYLTNPDAAAPYVDDRLRDHA